jgi:hypothetical protein
MRSRSAVLLAVAAIPVVLGGCGGRDATAPSPGRWVGAERIDDAPTDPFAARVGFPALGVDGSGRAIAAWGQDAGIRSRPFVPGRGWGPPEALPKTGPGNAFDPEVAVNGIGTAVVIWRQTETPESGPVRVWSSRREPTGGWSAPAAIDGGEFLEGAWQIAVALDPAGNAIALWTSNGIVAARGSTDRGWLPPERLSRSGASPVVVVDTAGRALATWSEPEAGFAQQYVPGRGWLDVTRFGPDGEGRYYGPGRVAFDSSGRAVVVWERRSGGEFGPVVVWAARFDGRGWSGQSVISDRAVKSFFPVVALDARGALAVWTQFAFPNVSDDGVVSRRAPFGSSWETPLRFWTAQDAVTTALAMNLHGEAVAAWAQTERPTPSSDLQYRLWASRYAGGQWTPAASLQAGPGWAQSPAVAIDEEGNATVAWVEHAGATASIWTNRFQVDRR